MYGEVRRSDWWKVIGVYVVMAAAVVSIFASCGCDSRPNVNPGPQAASGVKEIRPEVKTGADGLTNEQRNIKDRYGIDNMPGAIKHLYVISAYSGDVLIYSTVKGKVTSSGKRLTPTSVYAGEVRTRDLDTTRWGIPIVLGGRQQLTGEVLQDDGTYGDSIHYLYWFDSKGIYHQHYPNGGQIIHVSNEPLAVKKVILNMEQAEK